MTWLGLWFGWVSIYCIAIYDIPLGDTNLYLEGIYNKIRTTEMRPKGLRVNGKTQRGKYS